MREDTGQRQDTERLPGASRATPAEGGGSFLGHLLNSLMTKVIVVIVIVLVGAYVLLAKIEDLNPFASHTTITTTVVLGKLTKIEQVHVATRSYPVDVRITQSVGIIPCFLICNQMELTGSGTDDAIVNLGALSKRDVSIDQAADAVTVRMAAPVIGPAYLNPITCTITSGHGAVNSVTQAFRNNPNGYRPLYQAAQTQIHAAAEHDRALLAAGEQSTRAMLARVLGAAGVKKVTVDFG
ncbi:MAG TPA: DUF4230 domain-containing protein [Trebonia sp.]|jgi:hypothetical protein|nr:DUF4230 domain-containing protein [Trebonia sp.]